MAVGGIGLLVGAWLIDDTQARYQQDVPALRERSDLLHRAATVVALAGGAVLILAFVVPRL
jgi:hypothetical protein